MYLEWVESESALNERGAYRRKRHGRFRRSVRTKSLFSQSHCSLHMDEVHTQICTGFASTASGHASGWHYKEHCYTVDDVKDTEEFVLKALKGTEIQKARKLVESTSSSTLTRASSSINARQDYIHRTWRERGRLTKKKFDGCGGIGRRRP
ncbi:unnamed protein product [Arctogadus glacialis]